MIKVRTSWEIEHRLRDEIHMAKRGVSITMENIGPRKSTTRSLEGVNHVPFPRFTYGEQWQNRKIEEKHLSLITRSNNTEGNSKRKKK